MGSSGIDNLLGMTANAAGILLTGSFDGPTYFGGTNVTRSAGTGTFSDVFLTKLTDAGTTRTVDWSLGAGGSNDDVGTTVTTVGNTAYVSGYVVPPALFGTLSVGTAGSAETGYISSAVFGPVSSISGLSTSSGAVGTVVTLNGTNLTGTTALTLNGQAITGFTVNPTGTSITFTVPAGATAGIIQATTPNGTASTASGFCVQYAPTATGASRCGPSSVTLLASGAPSGGSYAWYASASGGAPVSTGNASSFATPVLSSNTTYYVGITTGSGATACEGPRTAATATLNAAPALAVATPGGTVLCPGGSLTLTATGAATYVWSTGATGASISATAPGSYSVTGTTAAGCSATSGATVIASGGAPTASISVAGPTALCPGGSVVLTANSGSSYQWSTGATSQAITVTTPGSYSVTVGNGACTATSAPTAVSASPAATASISAGGATTFCPGGSVTLTASGGGTYQWSSGQTSASITVSQAGSYSVTATNAAGCSAVSAPVAVTTNAAPTASIAASGPTTLCPGGSVTLTASGGASYQWSTGATSASITVSQGGSYAVTATNAAGCTAISAPTTVTVAPAAIASITTGGPTTLCPGGSVTLTANGLAGSSYQWSTGATTPTLNVTQGGSYTVTATTPGGCTATSAAMAVAVSPAAVASITTSGPTTFCPGSSVTLTANGTAGSSYQWSTGATTPTLNVTQGGSYTVTATNAAGCTATSAATAVAVNPAPATPTVTGNVGNLTATSSSATGNQWYVNNVLVPGATGQTISTATTRQQGLYSVVVTSAAGCASAPSNQVLLVVLGTAPAAVAAQVQLYPNPSTGRVALTLPATRIAQVQVLNALGQVVQTRSATGPVLLDLSGLAHGIYTVRVQLGEDVLTRRLALE